MSTIALDAVVDDRVSVTNALEDQVEVLKSDTISNWKNNSRPEPLSSSTLCYHKRIFLSRRAQRTTNPVRKILEQVASTPAPLKAPVKLRYSTTTLSPKTCVPTPATTAGSSPIPATYFFSSFSSPLPPLSLPSGCSSSTSSYTSLLSCQRADNSSPVAPACFTPSAGLVLDDVTAQFDDYTINEDGDEIVNLARVTKEKESNDDDILVPMERIPLSLGDPTVFGNLNPPEVLTAAVVKAVMSNKCNGYAPAAGLSAARVAIAQHYSNPGSQLKAEDVFIASGCSGALELVLGVLMDEGDNLLVPRPGFSLYEVITNSIDAHCRYYDLKPDCDWEMDFDHLRSLIDGRTKAILLANPSNPCGSVYRREHLLDLLELARQTGLPVICDEIYAGMTFDDEKKPFISLSSLAGDVPVITTGGLSKQFVVPGWRVGWVMLHDTTGAMKDVREGMNNLCQLILGANTLIQAVIPEVLTPIAHSMEEKQLHEFHNRFMNVLRENAALTVEYFSRKAPGLSLTAPAGAMYAMVKIDEAAFAGYFSDDTSFCKKLLEEENVFVLPGHCFKTKWYFRVVFAAPKAKLEEAYDRIVRFCKRHTRITTTI